MVQGSAVKHCARRVLSDNPADARITMVTSYVPVDPMAPDRCILRGPRVNSDLEILYCQWAEYRMESIAGKVANISKVGTHALSVCLSLFLCVCVSHDVCSSEAIFSACCTCEVRSSLVMEKAFHDGKLVPGCLWVWGGVSHACLFSKWTGKCIAPERIDGE